MKKAFRIYSTFTRQERTGILVLLALMGVCIGAPYLLEPWLTPVPAVDSTFAAAVLAFRREMAAADTPLPKPRWPRRSAFRFPRDSAPRFTARPASAAARARPFHRPYKQPEIDINTADSAAWEALPGIGPVLAARIVRFRERLGGFHATGQVAETYGLPDSTFKKIQPSLRLHNVSLKKIDINQMDEKSLAQHPYIRYKLAHLIVRYRSIHGPFSRPADLLGIPLVNDSIYRKLDPYVTTGL